MNYFLSAILLCSVSYSMGMPQRFREGRNQGSPREARQFAPEVFAPKPYSYAYEVVDPLGDTNFGHRETSDGAVVEGEYRVILPDGRTQIVTYSASDATGYVAEVRYEGAIKPYVPAPRPVVVPAPVPFPGAPLPVSGLPVRPVHKRKVQSLANQEKRNKRKQQQAKKQQGSIQFQKDDDWTNYGQFQDQE